MTERNQLTMLAERRRVGDPAQLLSLLFMAEDLLDQGHPFADVADALDFPTQGNVSREDRLREALDIARAWPEPALKLARQFGADWHALREPARWWRNGRCEREEVAAFATEFVERKGRWPKADEFRRRFGLADGHKGPGDAPGQGALLEVPNG